jgi:hypothetical protein
MQEYYRAEGQLLSGVADCDIPVFATGGAIESDAAIRRQLEEARSLARKGDTRGARLLCAEIVLEQQLRLHDNRNLLRVAIAALVHARGFQLLSRLLQAVDGRRVRISVITTTSATASPPHLIRRSLLDGIEVFGVEEGLFTDPSCDTIIDRWAGRLLEATGTAPESVAA